jgi:putative FmdB family regulatory protein
MPIFDYECTNCSNKEEIVTLNFSDSEGLKCSKCGSPLIKLPSRFGFDLKGNGWYNPGRKT